MDLRDALIDWDEPADEGSNTSHIAEHGLTPEEVETALFDENTTFDVSDSSGRPIAFSARCIGGSGLLPEGFHVPGSGCPLLPGPRYHLRYHS